MMRADKVLEVVLVVVEAMGQHHEDNAIFEGSERRWTRFNAMHRCISPKGRVQKRKLTQISSLGVDKKPREIP